MVRLLSSLVELAVANLLLSKKSSCILSNEQKTDWALSLWKRALERRLRSSSPWNCNDRSAVLHRSVKRKCEEVLNKYSGTSGWSCSTTKGQSETVVSSTRSNTWPSWVASTSSSTTITIAVSEGSEGLSGNEAVDKMMSDLLKVVKRHNVWLGLISHLRKAQGGKSFEDGNMASIDDIKGSGSIKQISFDIIAFARDLTAEDEEIRNTTTFRVLKSRFTGRTGNAGSATYNPRTTRLTGGINFEGF